MFRFQALNDPSRYNFMASKKTLEINPYHPIIVELAKKSKDNADDDSTKELAFVLYDSSLITAGFDIDDQVTLRTNKTRTTSFHEIDFFRAGFFQHTDDENASEGLGYWR